MRQKNWRMIIAGFVLAGIAVGFFFFTISIAPQSNDPVSLMQTAGTITGAVVGISIAMILVGLIGKKVR